MKVLSVKNLSISAGSVPLVKNVSFEVEHGRIMGLVGESGSGKTLTALSIMGLLPPALQVSGDISPDYAQSRGLKAGMIFQEPMTSLNPLHTIGKQIGEAVRIHHPLMRKPQIHARTQELLDKVGLAHFKERLDAYPHQLSGGERQRVMIAMAIANDPQLLIADEPTTALDVTIQAQILALIQELCQRLNMAVLLITHDLMLVRRVAQNVAIMSQGEIVEQGETAAIFDAPKHPYTKKLLSSEPGKSRIPENNNSAPLIECEELSITYSQRHGLFAFKELAHTAVRDITLSVPQGETLGIVGESGSGKTSLALALLKLISSKGSIRFGGKSIEHLKGAPLRALRRDMQVVFQDPFSSLDPRMQVGAIIREGLDLHFADVSSAERETRLDEILKEVGLPSEAKDRYPHEFSGGQRQRISIARALILRPRLIVFDEPTSALDLSVQAQILKLLRDLQQKYQLTYIFISHDLRVVRAVSHRILVLKNGEIVESGEAKRIFEQPQAPYTKELLKAAML